MNTAAHALQEVDSFYSQESTVETTLYDLIEAIIEEVQAGEEEIMTEAICHLINSGKTKFIDGCKDLKVIGR